MERIPFLKLNDEINDIFGLLVKTIIDLKYKNIETDTSDLEAQIDQLVYQLYDLTEEEIAIVENSSK